MRSRKSNAIALSAVFLITISVLAFGLMQTRETEEEHTGSPGHSYSTHDATEETAPASSSGNTEDGHEHSHGTH